eukprot:s1275_g8.t1
MHVTCGSKTCQVAPRKKPLFEPQALRTWIHHCSKVFCSDDWGVSMCAYLTVRPFLHVSIEVSCVFLGGTDCSHPQR